MSSGGERGAPERAVDLGAGSFTLWLREVLL